MLFYADLHSRKALLYFQVSSSGIHLGDDDENKSTKGKPDKPQPKIIKGKPHQIGWHLQMNTSHGTIISNAV